eukprot:g82486.t1
MKTLIREKQARFSQGGSPCRWIDMGELIDSGVGGKVDPWTNEDGPDFPLDTSGPGQAFPRGNVDLSFPQVFMVDQDGPSSSGGGRRRIDIEQLLNSEAEGEKVPWTQDDEYGRSMAAAPIPSDMDNDAHALRWTRKLLLSVLQASKGLVRIWTRSTVVGESNLRCQIQSLAVEKKPRHTKSPHNETDAELPKRSVQGPQPGGRSSTWDMVKEQPSAKVKMTSSLKAATGDSTRYTQMLLAPASSTPAHVQPNPKRKRPDGHNGTRPQWKTYNRNPSAHWGSISLSVAMVVVGDRNTGPATRIAEAHLLQYFRNRQVCNAVVAAAVTGMGTPADPVVALDKNTAGSNNSSLPDLLASQQNMSAPNARKRKEPSAADGSAARREMEKQREPQPRLPLSSPLERETTQSQRKGGWEGAEKHHCLTGAVVATPAPRAVHRNSSVVSNASSKPFNTATAATLPLQDVPNLKMKLRHFLITWLHGFERRPTLRCPLAKKWQRHEDKSLRQLVSPEAKLKQVLNTFLARLAYAHTCTPNGLAADADKNPIHARTGDSGILFLGLKVLVPSHGRLDIRVRLPESPKYAQESFFGFHSSNSVKCSVSGQEASGNAVAYIEHISDVRFVLRNGKESIAVIRNLQTTKNKVLASQLLGPETLRQWESTYSVYTKHQHGAPLEPAYVISPDQCKGLLSSCELSVQPVEVIQRSSPSSAVSAASSGADSLGGFRIVLTVPDSVLPQSLQAPPAGIPPRPEARGCAQHPPVADACKGTGVAIAATPSLTANSTVSSQQQPPSAPGSPAELPSEVMELDCRDCRDLQLTKKERTALETFSKWLHRKGWCLSGAVENPFEAVALLLNALGIEGGGHTEKSLRKGCEDIFGRLPVNEQRKMAEGTGFEPDEYRALVEQTLQEFQLRQKQWEQRKDDRINMPREPAGWDANVAELVCRRFHVSIHTHKPRKRDLDTGGSRIGQGGHHLRYLTMERWFFPIWKRPVSAETKPAAPSTATTTTTTALTTATTAAAASTAPITISTTTASASTTTATLSPSSTTTTTRTASADTAATAAAAKPPSMSRQLLQPLVRFQLTLNNRIGQPITLHYLTQRILPFLTESDTLDCKWNSKCEEVDHKGRRDPGLALREPVNFCDGMKFCHAYSLSQEERRLSPERLKALLRPRRKKFRKDLITTLTAELEKQGFKNVKLLAESRHDRFAANSGEFYVHDALQRMGYNSFMRLWVNEFPRHSLEKVVQAVNLARPDLRRRDIFPYQTDATRDVPGALPPNHRERLVKSGAVVTADSEEGKRLLEGHRNFRPWPENKPMVLLPKDPRVGDFCPKFAKVNMMTAELPDGSKRQIAVKLIEKAYDKTLHVLTIGCSNTNPVGNKASQIVASDDPNIHQNFRQESFANQGYTRFEISSYTHPLIWFPSGSEEKRALDDLENAVCDAKSLVQSSISTNIHKLYASRKSVTLWIDIVRCQVWLDWWKAGRRVTALPVWRRSFKESLTTMLKNVAALIGELPLRVVFTTYNLRSPEGNVTQGPSLDLAMDRWMENYTTAGELTNPKLAVERTVTVVQFLVYPLAISVGKHRLRVLTTQGRKQKQMQLDFLWATGSRVQMIV